MTGVENEEKKRVSAIQSPQRFLMPSVILEQGLKCCNRSQHCRTVFKVLYTMQLEFGALR